MCTCALAVAGLPVITVAGLTLWVMSASSSVSTQYQEWLPQPQLVELFARHSPYQETAIKQRLTAGPLNSYRSATPQERSWLKDNGALKGKTSVVKLVSLKHALQVGQDLGVPGHVLADLAKLQQSQPVTTLAHAVAPAPPLHVVTPATATALEHQCSLTQPAIQPCNPDSLPTASWSEEEALEVTNYGLSTQPSARGAVLGRAMAELAQLEKWCKEPIRLSRPQGCSMLASSTWDGV